MPHCSSDQGGMIHVPYSFVKRSYEPLLWTYQETEGSKKKLNKHPSIPKPHFLLSFWNSAEPSSDVLWLWNLAEPSSDVLWHTVFCLGNSVSLSSSHVAPSPQIFQNYFDSTINPGFFALFQFLSNSLSFQDSQLCRGRGHRNLSPWVILF